MGNEINHSYMPTKVKPKFYAKKCHENGKAMIENGKKNYLEAWDTFDWLHHTFIYQ